MPRIFQRGESILYRNKPKDHNWYFRFRSLKEKYVLFPLLVSVLPQTLLALVGGHLVSFTFLSAGHNNKNFTSRLSLLC